MPCTQGVMKNGPGYLDVAVCSHMDMLKVVLALSICKCYTLIIKSVCGF